MGIFEIDVKNKPDNFSQIYFGMGCFWGAERKFWHLDGLYTTVVGYAGGHTTILIMKKFVQEQLVMQKL